MKVRILSSDSVGSAINMPIAIETIRAGFAALAAGKATVPVRVALETPHGVSLFMPAHLTEQDSASVKIVSVNEGNTKLGLPVIHAVIVVFDTQTGCPVAFMDGTWLTALRTGAVGGLAADLLARKESKTVALFGAGTQARTQLEAVRCVRDIEEVRVISRTTKSAEDLVGELTGLEATSMADPDKALAGADIIITATSSSTPVFDGALVEPGTHVTGVGSFTTDMREVDATLVERARVIVDQKEAILEEAGDIVGPINDGLFGEEGIAGEIGDVILNRIAGRTGPEEITYFKSVGNAVQDTAVAASVLSIAEREGLGEIFDL